MRARIIWKSSCPRASCATSPAPATFYDGHLQMLHPDRVVDAAGFCRAAADRSGLSAHRGAASEPGAQGDGCGARAPAGAAGMAGCGVAFAQRLSGLRRSAAHASIGRKRPTISRRKARAWSRLAYDELLASQLALALAARAHAQARRPRQRRRGPSARTHHRRAALLADAVARARGHRHRRRSGAAAAHVAAAARRCRLRQDGGGADRRRDM